MKSGGLQTAVVGVTGYAGFELARLLMRHPRLKPPLLFVRESSGNGATGGAGSLADVFPQVSGNGSYSLEPFSWKKLESKAVDLLFLATPHEISRAWVPECIEKGVRVVDLSGAWRLRSLEYREVYGFDDQDPELASKLGEQAVYGLTELNREGLADAQLVANPGCYATSIILALAPLVRAEVIALEHGVVCDSKSGVSGAGKQPTSKTHFVEVADNLQAYSVFGHRHTGEILEQLGWRPQELMFTPHLLPIPRGILSTIYVRLKRAFTAAELQQCIKDFYADSPFVRVFAPAKLPQIQFSLNTNFCDLGFCLDAEGKRLVLISCLDNLLKGAAGQAVQNMNVMYGWDAVRGASR